MFTQLLTVIVALLAVPFAGEPPSVAVRECLGPGGGFKHIRADLIFAGTVRKKEPVQAPAGWKVTFDARHVWTSPSTKAQLVYQFFNPDSSDILKIGGQYVILASAASDVQRSWIPNLSRSEDAFVLHNCSGIHDDTPRVVSQLRAAFGPGQKVE
jgi:hypothetical protein